MLDVYIESSPKKTLELEFSVSLLSIVGVFVVSRQKERWCLEYRAEW